MRGWRRRRGSTWRPIRPSAPGAAACARSPASLPKCIPTRSIRAPRRNWADERSRWPNLPEHRAQPLQCLPEPLGRAGEAQPEITLARRPERGARREADLAAPHDLLGEFEAVGHAVDAEEGIERAVRRRRAHARETGQPGHDDVAAGAAALDHAGDEFLAVAERRDGGRLQKGRRAGGIELDELV